MITKPVTINHQYSNYLLICMALFLFSGCIGSTPKRTFKDSDLLIKVDAVPDGWLESEFTDNTPYGTESAENRSYRTFYYSKTNYLVKVGEDIFRYRTSGWAARNFNKFERYRMTQGGSELTPWVTPEDFSFTSDFAQKSRFACVYSSFSPTPEFGNKSYLCLYIAHYQEFIVLVGFTKEIDGVEYLSMDQIVSILEAVDKNINKYLKIEQ